jgi:hypothetical protein
MASIPLVSGGSQPVFATDTLNGPQLASTATYTPANTPTNFQGPKLDFFGVDLGADPSAQAGVNGAIQYVLQAVQQTSTVAIYQVSATAAAPNLSLAIYPTGAYTAASLQTLIQGLGANVGGTGYDASGATVTNVGFRLNASAT